MLATNLPVYFTSSSLYHRVALILITNSMSLWIAIATLRVIYRSSRLRDVVVCDKLFRNDVSSIIIIYLAALAVFSSPITPFTQRRWLSILAIVHPWTRIHRYSKLTFPIFFSARVAFASFHGVSRVLSSVNYTSYVLSFPPQSIIIFFSSNWDYACLTGCLAWYFHCIVSRHFPRPSNLYLHFSDGKTIHWRMPC